MESVQSLNVPGYAVASLYEEVSSTMDVARSFLGLGKPAVCVARRQRAGRGRQGRTWSSSNEGFMGTFVFPTSRSPADLAGYSLAVGVAICEALNRFDAPVALKWPNDIVVMRDARLFKLGGVLIEVGEFESHRSVLVGIGINTHEAPEGVAEAQSIKGMFGRTPSIDDVAKALGESLLSAHSLFESSGGFGSFRERWLMRSCFQTGSARLKIDLGSEQIEGVFEGVDDRGALLLRNSGMTRTVYAGHVLSWSLATN